MKENYLVLCSQEPSKEQVSAWEDCYVKITPELEKYKDRKYYLVFEYELPHEGGRRPDLLILMKNTILAVEFKMKNGITRADLDQVSAYARDIKNYHKKSHQMDVVPFLIPTKTRGKVKEIDRVYACSPDMISSVIDPINDEGIGFDPEEWIYSSYEPLPSLVDAAKRIYAREELPFIRKANSAGIPEALQILKKAALDAEEHNRRILSLVTGVPGCGKTLLGLQYVYECFEEENDKKSVFLSGNGPLVKVLQHALKSKVFVQPLRNYIKYYGISKRSNPVENIVVFDEAQRAWDKEQVSQKHRMMASEPDLIIRIADGIPNWCVLLGLIGEGQEIHKGEEAGIEQWRDAIRSSLNKWEVICPNKIVHLFEDIAEVHAVEELDLTVSLRSHLAEDVTAWANFLLDSQIDVARALSLNIYEQGFKMYVTRDLNKAKRYCKGRYNGNDQKRYGLLASSKAKGLNRFGVDNSFTTTRQLQEGPWYNDPPSSPASCCRLDRVATEFACQGLELDMPIICWGDDMLWDGNHWKPFAQESKGIRNPNELRINSYRVLLTRGRDGLIVYMPDSERYRDTYDSLVASGLVEM